jgi:hypothetical protein
MDYRLAAAAGSADVRAPTALLWTAVAAIGLCELGVASLVLRPRVDPAYRAYFIDRSSDCWPHATAGTYALGQQLSFVDGHGTLFFANKICGWFYPGANGTWSYGSYSLLRFAFAPIDEPLTLTLTADAMTTAAHPAQRVAVSANGTGLGTLSFGSTPPQKKTLSIPANLAGTGRIELRFDYPDARPGTELGPNEDAHLRAIRMMSLTLATTPK